MAALAVIAAVKSDMALAGTALGVAGLAGLAAALAGAGAKAREAADAARNLVKGDLRQVAVRCCSLDEKQDPVLHDLGALAQNLTVSLQNLSNTAGTLAWFSKDLTGQSAKLSESASSSKDMARNVARSSSVLSGKMDEVNVAVEKSSSSINTMAAAIEELSTSEDQICQGIDRASAQCEEANDLAQDATGRVEGLGRAANAGAKGIEGITRAMAELEKRSTTLQEDMNQLGRKAQEIGRVLDVISDIADQTNLLALNAAIEAARAGDAGRGFAVVADEVRKLAEKTMTATKDVGEAIASIQGMATLNVKATQEAVEAISTSTRLAGEQIAAVEGIEKAALDAARDIGRVAAVVRDVLDAVRGVANAVHEQTQANREISGNIGGVASTLDLVSHTVDDGSRAFAQIAGDVQGVDANLSDIASVSLQVKASAREVAGLAEELERSLKGYGLGKPGLDVGKIKTLHLAWVARLESLMHGYSTLKPEQVADHHQCDFGKWYDSAGLKDLGHLDSFKEVGKHHEQVHALARQIVSLAQNGRKDEMARLMAQFEAVRLNMFAALDVLYRDSFK
jgi:methyl-accepting chemotaxis protein